MGGIALCIFGHAWIVSKHTDDTDIIIGCAICAVGIGLAVCGV